MSNSMRDAKLKALRKREVPEFDPNKPWSPVPPVDVTSPDFIEQRRQQELERAITDAQWLRERGIVAGRQPLARAAGAETYMGPTGDPSQAPGNDWRSMPMHQRIMQALLGENPEKQREFLGKLPQYAVQQYQEMMPLGDVPIRDKRGRVVDRVSRETYERLSGGQPLTGPEQAAADPVLMLADLLTPGPGGGAKEARVFFGSPAMRQRALYFLDWARKNLRGEARKGLLRSLEEGWVLSNRDILPAVGQYDLIRGRGGMQQPLRKFLEEEAEKALGEGPEEAKRFAGEASRFKRWWGKKKKDIVKEYEELAERGGEVPTAWQETPAPPISMIDVNSSHPLSTILHEGVHAADFGMYAHEFKRAKDIIKASSWGDLMKARYAIDYAETPHEQLAILLQDIGSGEKTLREALADINPALAQRQAQGWNLPELVRAFPKAEAGSRVEQRAMQPVLERWDRWKRGTSGFEGEPAFLSELAEEETLARKMRRR